MLLTNKPYNVFSTFWRIFKLFCMDINIEIKKMEYIINTNIDFILSFGFYYFWFPFMKVSYNICISMLLLKRLHRLTSHEK